MAQFNGKGDHNCAGEAALANPANLIAFRVGAPDAAPLAPWFAPDIDRHRRCALPDFQAAVRTLSDARVSAARVMEMGNTRLALGGV